MHNTHTGSKMSTFKLTITLQSDFSSQELADFFSALAKSEQGDAKPLMRILHPIEPPPSPIPVVEEPVIEPPPPPTPVPVQPTLPTPVPEPPVSEAIKRAVMGTDISCKRIESIIRRQNWARGQKARIERRWGPTKASCFARIGFHFNDYSLMDGSVSTENDLLQWVQARGFVGTF